MLKRVSFSGIDQWAKPQELAALHKDFPFVEFVFLLTESRKAGNRYPMPVMLKAYKKYKFPMAVHFCGKIAYEAVKGNDWQPAIDMLGTSFDLFDRIQLNIPKTSHYCRELTFPEGKQIIIQLHEGTEEFFAHYKHLPFVQGFQDGSGGHGVQCTAWRAPETEFFGYAGGIGPDNVVSVVKAINDVCDGDFWIDMETSIRTNDKFDVQKCRRVCEALVKEGLISAK